jgi:hypothetical protein
MHGGLLVALADDSSSGAIWVGSDFFWVAIRVPLLIWRHGLYHLAELRKLVALERLKYVERDLLLIILRLRLLLRLRRLGTMEMWTFVHLIFIKVLIAFFAVSLSFLLTFLVTNFEMHLKDTFWKFLTTYAATHQSVLTSLKYILKLKLYL